MEKQLIKEHRCEETRNDKKTQPWSCRMKTWLIEADEAKKLHKTFFIETVK